MIWLTWRQFRGPAAMASAALAVLAAVVAVTGPGLADAYSTGLASCAAGDGCERFSQQFFNDHRAPYFALSIAVLLMPALLGLFWGAPLIARELEAGTHRLVWNQSVTRTRWLAAKLSLVGAGVMVVAGLAVLAVEWWSEPLDRAAAAEELSRLTPMLFMVRGVAPVGYAAFAFALGVAVGMLVRRTLVAMAVTLAVFIALQIAMPLVVRPHLMPPEDLTTVATRENMDSLMSHGATGPVRVRLRPPGDGAWVLTNDTLDPSGRVVESIPLDLKTGPCADNRGPGQEGPPAACIAQIGRMGYRQHLVYHPADRYWPLQWAETGVYVGLAAILTGFTFWWVRRRVS